MKDKEVDATENSMAVIKDLQKEAKSSMVMMHDFWGENKSMDINYIFAKQGIKTDANTL